MRSISCSRRGFALSCGLRSATESSKLSCGLRAAAGRPFETTGAVVRFAPAADSVRPARAAGLTLPESVREESAAGSPLLGPEGGGCCCWLVLYVRWREEELPTVPDWDDPVPLAPDLSKTCPCDSRKGMSWKDRSVCPADCGAEELAAAARAPPVPAAPAARAPVLDSAELESPPLLRDNSRSGNRRLMVLTVYLSLRRIEMAPD